ncbi:MAG TPA: hypothetical protein VHX38_36345 [Pseudonocardiaceae bacterium]|nr:hypothetical protein [Pseudonocardiaceae bacterium]
MPSLRGITRNRSRQDADSLLLRSVGGQELNGVAGDTYLIAAGVLGLIKGTGSSASNGRDRLSSKSGPNRRGIDPHAMGNPASRIDQPASPAKYRRIPWSDPASAKGSEHVDFSTDDPATPGVVVRDDIPGRLAYRLIDKAAECGWTDDHVAVLLILGQRA